MIIHRNVSDLNCTFCLHVLSGWLYACTRSKWRFLRCGTQVIKLCVTSMSGSAVLKCSHRSSNFFFFSTKILTFIAKCGIIAGMEKDLVSCLRIIYSTNQMVSMDWVFMFYRQFCVSFKPFSRRILQSNCDEI